MFLDIFLGLILDFFWTDFSIFGLFLGQKKKKSIREKQNEINLLSLTLIYAT
jgi:hypothetical protein